MSDPAVGAKDLLVAAGIGTFAGTSGWGIFIGKLPQKPETAIAVVGTGGQTANPKYLLDYPSIQVLIRGAKNGYQAAYAKALASKNTLLGLSSQTVNGDWWVQVNMIGDITPLGFDENDCPMFSVNFSLIIEPASSAGMNRTPL